MMNLKRGFQKVTFHLVVSFSQLFLVVASDHFKEVQVTVEGFVFMTPQLVDGRLDPQHKQLVP